MSKTKRALMHRSVSVVALLALFGVAGQARAQLRLDRYMAPANVCQTCPVRDLCTTSKEARSITRPIRMPILERATARMRTPEGKAHRKRRQWMMEGSFAHSVRLGYKRARARGLSNMRIQDYLVAAIQNLLILLRAKGRMGAQTAPKCLSGALAAARTALTRAWRVFAPFRAPASIVAATPV